VSTPVVRICRGSDCRKKRKACRKLDALLLDRARVQGVSCQKICDGPVLGLEVEGHLEWFEDVAGRDVRRAVDAFLESGALKKALRKRRIKKRAGKLR
jgi:(2Fe-2S) ferredoxin